MLHQLKNVFPSLKPYTGGNRDGYMWFITDKHETVGIHENDVTKRDIALLATFLKPYQPRIPMFNNKAKQWQTRIHEHTNEAAQHAFRFVYFLIPANQIDPEALQEALNELFHQEIPILWLNEVEGVLVETMPFLDDKIDYEQFIHVFIADLSVKIRFFVGELQKSYDSLKSYYDTILHQASIAFSSTTKEVIYYAESISYSLLHLLPSDERKQMVSSILKDFTSDPEMLKTLRIFLDSNLNISETAKKMYMHRNSVQYRIDKYMNETGINIQRFNEAIAVQMALIANK